MRSKIDVGIGGKRLKVLARFFRKVRFTRDGHWLWKGAKHGSQPGRGYTKYKCGSFWHEGRARSAHIVIWELANGPIPKGKQINHACGRALCVNPDHLYLGDQSENMNDLFAHGHASGKQNGGNIRSRK